MITASTIGAPNWVDLATTDIDGAVEFYRGLLGWEVERSTTPNGDYYIGHVDGQQVAGMMAQSPEGDSAVPMWTVFFNVEDVDEVAAQVRAAGGSVLHPPSDIPEARIAIVADPLGAMFGLFEGPEIEGTWLDRKEGAVCWVETMNRDPSAGEAFYAAVFSWKAETEVSGDRSYTTLSLEEAPVAGMMMMPAEMDPDIPAFWSHYFAVTDCEDTVTKAIELGGSVVRPPEFVDEMGSFAVLSDPQGAVFQVMDFIV